MWVGSKEKPKGHKAAVTRRGGRAAKKGKRSRNIAIVVAVSLLNQGEQDTLKNAGAHIDPFGFQAVRERERERVSKSQRKHPWSPHNKQNFAGERSTCHWRRVAFS